MTNQLSLTHSAKLSVIVILALAMAGCAGYMGGSSEDAKFTAVEVDSVKLWQGGGTVDIKGRTTPLTLTVKNTLAADHGFAIDSMKVKEVIKAGEERTIAVQIADIDTTVTDHRVYCQLHPKHGPATLTVTNVGRSGY